MNEVEDFLERHTDAIHTALVSQELDEIFSKMDLKTFLAEGRSKVRFLPIIDSIMVIDRPKIKQV